MANETLEQLGNALEAAQQKIGAVAEEVSEQAYNELVAKMCIRDRSCGHSPPGRNAPFQAHPPGIQPQEPPEPSGAPGVCAAVPAGDGVHGAARGMAAVREIRKVGFIWMISR